MTQRPGSLAVQVADRLVAALRVISLDPFQALIDALSSGERNRVVPVSGSGSNSTLMRYGGLAEALDPRRRCCDRRECCSGAASSRPQGARIEPVRFRSCRCHFCEQPTGDEADGACEGVGESVVDWSEVAQVPEDVGVDPGGIPSPVDAEGADEVDQG